MQGDVAGRRSRLAATVSVMAPLATAVFLLLAVLGTLFVRSSWRPIGAVAEPLIVSVFLVGPISLASAIIGLAGIRRSQGARRGLKMAIVGVVISSV